MRHTAASVPNPSGSEAMRIQLAIVEEVAQTSGGGGDRGHGCRLHSNNDANAGGGTCHVRKGAPIANTMCIPVPNIRAGENTQDDASVGTRGATASRSERERGATYPRRNPHCPQ